jgi:hypothetical protein
MKIYAARNAFLGPAPIAKVPDTTWAWLDKVGPKPA